MSHFPRNLYPQLDLLGNCIFGVNARKWRRLEASAQRLEAAATLGRHMARRSRTKSPPEGR